MTSRTGAAGAIAFLVLAACATVQTDPVSEADPAASLEFRGFSIKPPPGSGWVLVERGRESVFFGKKTGSQAHVFVALAFSERIPDPVSIDSVEDYFDFVKQTKRAGFVPGRHWFLEEEYGTERTPGPTCIRYRLKFLDTGSPQAPGVPLPLEVTGFSCAHPDSLQTAIDVQYSERGGPGAGNEELRKEGEVFIHSVVFTPLK